MTPAEMRAMLERIQNRKRYRSLDRATLAAIADDDLVTAICDHLSDHVMRGPTPADLKRTFEALSPGLRTIWATRALDDQVKNGGFAQFFWNPSVRYANAAREGFVLVGARQHHDLVDEAMDRFMRAAASEKALVQQGDLEAFRELAEKIELDDLSRAYWRLDRSENLKPLQIAYIRSHIDEFISN